MPEAAEYFGDVKPPKEATLPGWADLYWSGWQALRHDRHYGSMGGMSPIFYQAISRYARDHELNGAGRALFHRLVNAMDAEYLAHVERMTPKPDTGSNYPNGAAAT